MIFELTKGTQNEGWLSGKFSGSKGRKTYMYIRRWIIWNFAVDD